MEILGGVVELQVGEWIAPVVNVDLQLGLAGLLPAGNGDRGDE